MGRISIIRIPTGASSPWNASRPAVCQLSVRNYLLGLPVCSGSDHHAELGEQLVDSAACGGAGLCLVVVVLLQPLAGPFRCL